MNGLPEKVRIAAQGRIRIEGPQFSPHDMAFPSAMMSLRVFMGLPHRTHELSAHGMTWRGDDDYYFHLGVSGEAWRFLFDTAEYFRIPEPCGAETVIDCLEAEGFPYEIYSKNPTNGASQRSDLEMKRLVLETLAGGYPALVLGRTANDWVLLATGYDARGETLVAWTFVPGGEMTNKSFSPEDCQYVEHWWEGADAVVLVKGKPKEGVDRKPIFRRALTRAVDSLRSAKANPNCRYANFYDDWIAQFRDAARWQGKPEGRAGIIDPAIWDLAERRAYAADFLRQAEGEGGISGLGKAVDAMHQIHDLMWRVNDLAGSPESPKLGDAAAREAIIAVLEQCRALDREAAGAIEQALSGAR